MTSASAPTTQTSAMSAVSVQHNSSEVEILYRSLLPFVNSNDMTISSTAESQPHAMTQRDSEFLKSLAKDIFWGFDDEDTNTDGIDWAVICQIVHKFSQKAEIEYPQQTAVSS